MDKAIYYIVFFFVGMVAGWFYFTNLWKSVSTYGADKGKLIFSSFLRFPVPIVAVLVAGLVSGIGGIISTIAGFTVFQFIYLIKRGSQLKKEIEEFAKQQEENNQVEAKDGNNQ